MPCCYLIKRIKRISSFQTNILNLLVHYYSEFCKILFTQSFVRLSIRRRVATLVSALNVLFLVHLPSNEIPSGVHMKRFQYLLWFAHEHVCFRIHVRYINATVHQRLFNMNKPFQLFVGNRIYRLYVENTD